MTEIVSGEVYPFQLVNEMQSLVKVLPVLKLFMLSPVEGHGMGGNPMLKMQSLEENLGVFAR